MVKWSSLDLRTRMQMYAAKLDLEIDAHLRLIKGLAAELDQMPPGLAREALEDQVGAARRNLGNLADRRVELASFGPLDRLKARLGFGTLATRLEQPPRLFSKGPARPPGWMSGPAAPPRVVEQRAAVAKLRSQIADLEAQAGKGRLSKGKQERLDELRQRLGEHYAVGAAGSEPAQLAVLFDRRPGESLPDYQRRLQGLEPEVLEHAAAKENDRLLDAYQGLVHKTAADDLEHKGLQKKLADINDDARTNAIKQNDNLRARSKAEPHEMPKLLRDLAELETKATALQADLVSVRNEIRGFERPPSLFFGDQPWKSVQLVDPLDPHIRSRLGLVGELDTVAALQDVGFDAIGRTVNPKAVKTVEAFESELGRRRGQRDIDVIARKDPLHGPPAPGDRSAGRPTGVIDYIVGDAKATGEINPRPPTGSGRLSTMVSDEDITQLSNPWLRGHLKKAGLHETDRLNIDKALERPGAVVTVIHPDGTEQKVRVRKVYGQTFRDSSGTMRTRLYEVRGDPPTIVGTLDPDAAP